MVTCALSTVVDWGNRVYLEHPVLSKAGSEVGPRMAEGLGPVTTQVSRLVCM